MEQGVLVGIMHVRSTISTFGFTRVTIINLRGISTKINLIENCVEKQVRIVRQIRGILALEISSSPLAKYFLYIFLNTFLPFFLAYTWVFISN